MCPTNVIRWKTARKTATTSEVGEVGWRAVVSGVGVVALAVLRRGATRSVPDPENVRSAASPRNVTTERLRLCGLLLIACATLGHVDLAAQSIDGILLERGTDRPIDMGLVTLFGVDGDSVASVLSDGAGRFRVESPEAGEFRLAASALGYRPTVASSVFMLAEGGSMSLEFRIEPLAIEVGGITVEARSSLIRQPKLVLNGFVERAQQGFGRFITPVDIEKSAAMSTADLLMRTGRVTTRYAIGGDRIVMRGTRGYCTPIVYVDGVRISMSGLSLDAIAPVSVLEAAEVYRSGNEAPVQYGGGMGGCGVIVLWTRAR